MFITVYTAGLPTTVGPYSGIQIQFLPLYAFPLICILLLSSYLECDQVPKIFFLFRFTDQHFLSFLIYNMRAAFPPHSEQI